MRYFDHDTAASIDDKILALRLEHGGAAVDVYWTLLEKMYRDEEPVSLAETNPKTKALTVCLAVGLDVIKTYVSYMVSIGLFETLENDEDTIFSRRALENISAYNEKCETARQNGKKGGRKPKAKPSQKPNANRTLTDGKADAKLIKGKGIGFDKQNQIPTVSGVGTGEPAPHHGESGRWACPVCHSTAYFDAVSGKWSCPRHFEIGEAEWVPEEVGVPCPDHIRKAIGDAQRIDQAVAG